MKKPTQKKLGEKAATMLRVHGPAVKEAHSRALQRKVQSPVVMLLSHEGPVGPRLIQQGFGGIFVAGGPIAAGVSDADAFKLLAQVGFPLREVVRELDALPPGGVHVIVVKDDGCEVARLEN